MATAYLTTPIGPVSVHETDGWITDVGWETGPEGQADSDLLAMALSQIADYFAGKRQVFDLPTKVRGSDLQRAVCDRMSAIPFGETVTYGDIAKDLNRPAQAIGQACGGNPIPIIIPCHRVLGAQGLGGFSAKGGVETKVALLRHEGAAGLLI